MRRIQRDYPTLEFFCDWLVCNACPPATQIYHGSSSIIIYYFIFYIIFIIYRLFFILKINYYFISSRFNKIFKIFLSFLKKIIYYIIIICIFIFL